MPIRFRSGERRRFVICTAGVAVAARWADIWGRKRLMLLSAVGMGLCMATLAAYFEQRDISSSQETNAPLFEQPVTTWWTWAGFTAIVGYLFFNQLGIGPLVSVVSAEIVPASMRGLALGIASAIGGGVVGAASSYSTLPLASTVGYDLLFAGYACANLGIVGFLLACVPETAGQTLEALNAAGGARGL